MLPTVSQPRLLLLSLLTTPLVSGQPLAAPDGIALDLVYNTAHNPSPLDLITESILKYGLFKNAADFPQLRSHLDGLGLGKLVGPLLHPRGASRHADLARHSRLSRNDHSPRGLTAGLLGGVLPVKVDVGIGLDLGLASTDIDTNLDLHLGFDRTLVDNGWGGATTTRLANSQSDNAWFAPIEFGTPGQTLTMFIDSGSADTTVYNTSCSSCQLSNHTAFNTRASSSFVDLRQSFSTQYGDGTVLSGRLGSDTVAVSSALNVDSQLVAIINSRKGGSDKHVWDGIMGIGPDQLSYVDGNATPLSNLIKAGKLQAPLVGIALVKRNDLTGNPGGGEYRWGAISPRYSVGSITYAPVTSTYFWGTAMPSITVNGKQMLSTGDHQRALFDTGTTLVYTSDSVARKIHAQFSGASFDSQTGIWYIPCVTAGSPSVFIEIGGKKWGIPASDIAFRDSGRGDGLCMSGIQGGSRDFTLLGAVFIKNHYLVLNYGNSRRYSLSVGLSMRTDVAPIL